LREWASNGLLSMPVIMMSGHATIDTAVEATRIGAIDFLEKPITLQKLLRAVQAGLAHGRARRAPVSPAASVPERAPLTDAGRAVAGAAPRSESPTPSPFFAPGGFSSPMADRGRFEAADIEGALTLPEASGERYAPLGAEPALADALIDGLGGPGGHDPQRTVLLKMQALPIEAPLRDARDAFERAYFEYHLMREQGSMTRVAERTGLERTHLYRKLKQLGIDLSRGAWRKSSL
jgi:DNA-binding NtrC family response regulator